MQKIKFQIQGMHCNSCAFLIEEKLKKQPGIIKVKASYDSQKAIVIYDEQKIHESKIQQTIKSVGDYQVEKIEENKEENKNDEEKNYASYITKKENKYPKYSPKIYFWMGLLISFSVISLIVNIILIGPFVKFFLGNNEQSEQLKINMIQKQNLPSQDNPSAKLPPQFENQPAIQTFEITQKNNHIRGDFNAPITLVEFSDFECPFSEKNYPTMNKIFENYNGKVRLVYKHFPLSFHQNAQKAAEASECADEQGKFWEYHDKIFENQSSGLSVEKFKQWAANLDLNTKKFNDCLDSGKYTQKVQDDFQEGQQKEVNGTPATFINGQLISGALPYDSFKQIIDSLSQ